MKISQDHQRTQALLLEIVCQIHTLVGQSLSGRYSQKLNWEVLLGQTIEVVSCLYLNGMATGLCRSLPKSLIQSVAISRTSSSKTYTSDNSTGRRDVHHIRGYSSCENVHPYPTAARLQPEVRPSSE